jgi:hypothetical protein
MPANNGKRAFGRDMLIASAMAVAGFAISIVSVAELKARNPQVVAQATQPLQSTPGAESKPSVPAAEPATTGSRPSEIKPQPAQPDAEAQKSGATPALPPAPAEKMAPPIQQK